MEKQSKGNIQTPTFPLLIQEHPLAEPTVHNIAVGVRVSDILKNAPKHSGAEPQVLVNGEKVHGNYKPKEDDIVYVTLVPGFTGAYAWLNWVIVMVASAAISYALMPDIGDQQNGMTDENKFERISGLKNKSPLYEPYQAILGKRKVAPVYISRPYTTVEGDREYFHALMSAGYGPLKLENFRIGETAIEDFDDVEITVLDQYENSDENAIREVWQQDISQQQIQIELREEEGWTNRTTETNPETIVSNFLFPSGVFGMDDEGNNVPESVKIRQDIQDGNGDWWTVVVEHQSNQFGNISPNLYGVVKFEDGYYRWNSDGLDGIWGALDLLFLDEYSDPLSSFGNFETIEKDGLLFIKNFPENEKITSFQYTAATREPKLKSLSIPSVDEIWQGTTAINIRTRKEGPTQEQVEDNRGTANVSWENLQTIRPLTDEGFKEAIGYNRPKLRYDGNVVRNFRPTLIHVRMRATGQLNGNLDNFFCDATMVVPQDKNADWRNWPNLTLEPSVNPADAYKWLMQGAMNYSPIPIDKIDHDRLADWRSRCVSENWTISALLDYESTLLAELQNVAYTGRAEFQFNEGKFGVVEKIERTVPRQIFTPKNSANFQSKRVYPEVVDGVKFQFESAAVDYEKDEGVFLDPAKDPDNGGDASLLKGRYTTNELWGIDNFDQAYRLTRFEYYERFLQREIYTLDLDAEVLASQRGDLVRVQNDIINVGLGAGRVKAIDGSVVTLDETINTDNLPQNTGLQFRDDVGVITTTTASYLGDGKWDCDNLDASVSIGDLAIYGETGKEAIDCIIRGIKYNEDLGASLTLVNAANEIYNLDGNPIPEYNPSIALPTDTTQPPNPIVSANASKGVINVIVNSPDQTYPTNDYRAYVQARQFPIGRTVENYFENDNEGWGYIAQGDVAQSTFQIQGQQRGFNYELRVQYRRGDGASGGWSNTQVVTLEYGEGLPLIQNLNYVHQKDGTYLTYSPVSDPEFDRYEIRLDQNFGTQDSNYVGATKDNSFFLGLLESDQDYYVAVKNVYSAYSEPSFISVLQNVPAEPVNFIATNEGLGVRLTWSKLNTGYEIDYFEIRFTEAGVGDNFSQSIELGSVSGLSTTHSTISTGLYTYYIRAVDIAGNVSEWVNDNVDVERSSDAIDEELANINTIINDINTTLDDVEFSITENSTNFEDNALSTLDAITRQAASREELRSRIENDEVLIDAAVYVDPESGTIVNRAFNYADDRFTEAQLAINGVDARITATVQDVELIDGRVNDLSSELELVPGQITATANAVVAEAIQALDPAHSFNFFDSAQGWVAVNGTISTAVPNEISATWGDIENSNLTFVAEDNPVIRVTIERTSGTGWTGDLIIERDDATTHTFSGIIEDILSGGEIVRSIDLRGSDDWVGTINRVRLVLGASTSDEFTIKQIVIGKPDAALLELEDISQRVTSAEVEINAIDGRVNTVVDDLQTFEDDTADQFTSAQESIDAANGRITNSVFQIVGNSTDFEDAQLQSLDELVDSLQRRTGQIDRNLSYAEAISQLEVDVSEDGALARSIDALEAATVTQDSAIKANTQFIQEVETNVNGNASSLAQIAAGVTGEEDTASALIKLESYLEDGGLSARAFFGTDVNGQVTGIVVNDSGTAQQIEFQANTFAFLDGAGDVQVYWDTNNERYVFNGEIIAQAGSFTGSVTSSEGSIGGWNIEPNYMSSSESGQRIELDAGNSRIGVYDTVNEKVVMGYLDGLPKNDGTGNWGAGDYGFWARAGDGLTIDGTIDYTSGDFIVENDASVSIRDDQNREIVRLGTDNGTKGTFIYDISGDVLAEFSADKIEVGESTGDSLTYQNGNLDVSGGISADRGAIGGWSISGTSLTSGDTSLNSSTETLTLGSEVSLNKDAVNFGAGFAWDSTNGLVVDGDAEIAGWIVETGLFKSATSGARIELNATNNRVSVFDSVNEKVAMGYLGGLPKYDGSGNWASNNYGFWARQGDQLVIDGDMEYNNGDFIIENDASVKIRDGVNANEIMRWGTDAGVKGMFIYDASVADGSASNRIAEFSASRIEVGRNDEKLVYENGELDIEGGITADRGKIGGWTIGSTNLSNTVDGLGAIELNAAVPRIRIDDENGNARFVARPDKLTVGDKSNDYMEWTPNDGLDISGNISGGSIDLGNGTFTVDNSGNMVANRGTFRGSLDGVDGTFSGDISGSNGTFDGTVKAKNILGESAAGGFSYVSPFAQTRIGSSYQQVLNLSVLSTDTTYIESHTRVITVGGLHVLPVQTSGASGAIISARWSSGQDSTIRQYNVLPSDSGYTFFIPPENFSNNSTITYPLELELKIDGGGAGWEMTVEDAYTVVTVFKNSGLIDSGFVS